MTATWARRRRFPRPLSSVQPTRPHNRLALVAAAYAVCAFAVGALVAAVYALPCEGSGLCDDLDQSGGYVVLLVLPTAAVVIGGVVASKLRRPGVLHLAFATGLVTIPAVIVAVSLLS
jgi:hypothetical protein